MGMAQQARGNDDVQRALAELGPWPARFARLGYMAKGTVYVVVGGLAFQAAVGVGGRTTDTEGALTSIFRQPLGPVLLALVALGLFSYAAWRLAQSLLDLERKGRSPKGLVKRTGYLFSGLAYGGLGLSATRQVIGLTTGGGWTEEDWTAFVLGHPFGRWLVAAAGVVLLGLALNAAVVALRPLYARKLKQEEMSEGAEAVSSGLATVGLLARGLVFGLLGVFFIQAGWESDPQEVGGLSDVLIAIASQPQGPWLLGATSAGLIAYGLFALVQARYRRIPLPE